MRNNVRNDARSEVRNEVKQLISILGICCEAINSNDPSSIEEVLDDDSLLNKSMKIVEGIIGRRPSEVRVLEALYGISLFMASFSNNGTPSTIKFISSPTPMLVISSNDGNSVETTAVTKFGEFK